jgi:hypothetical protein
MPEAEQIADILAVKTPDSLNLPRITRCFFQEIAIRNKVERKQHTNKRRPPEEPYRASGSLGSFCRICQHPEAFKKDHHGHQGVGIVGTM